MQRFYADTEGQTTIRILGDPYEVAVHWVDLPGSKPRKVKCAASGCILCQNNFKVSVRYLAPILLKPQCEPRIFEFGPAIYNQLSQYYNHEKWGNLTQYDVIIDKNSRRGRHNSIFVVAETKIRMSDVEVDIVDEFLNKVDFEILSAPITNDEIKEVLGKDLISEIIRTCNDRPKANQFRSKKEILSTGEVKISQMLSSTGTTQKQWNEFVEEIRESKDAILWYDYDYNNPVCFKRLCRFGRINWGEPSILYVLISDAGQWYAPTIFREKDGLIREDFNFSEDKDEKSIN